MKLRPLFAFAVIAPLLAGCTAADQRLAAGATSAAACAWLAANEVRCEGGPGERLSALTAMQRAEVEALVARASKADPEAVRVALAALEAGAAGLRAVTKMLLELAEKGEGVAEGGKPAAP